MKALARLPIGGLLIAIIALAAYLPGFWWGTPHATAPDRKMSWGVDDETPLGPLAEIHNIIDPKPDRNLGYPLMYSFTVALSYAPYLAYLKTTGKWGKISGEYPFGFDDPVGALAMMGNIAHLLAVFMGASIVLAAYGIGSALMNQRAGILSALFAMTCYPMFYYSRNGNVDIPMLLFVSLTLLMFARCLAYGLTTGRVVWTGVFTGLALGTKEQALGALLLVPFALLILAGRNHRGGWRTRQFWRLPLIGAFASILSFGVGSGLFVEPGRYLAHVAFMWNRIGIIAKGDIFVPYVFPRTWEGNLGYLNRVWELLCDMLTMPGVILGIAGLVWLLARRPKSVWFAATLLVYLGFVFMTLRSPQMRYIMPGAYLLCFPAAWLVAAAWENPRPALRWGAMALAVGIIGFNLLRGIGLTYEMIRDSRYEAGEWLAERTGPGDSVEFFGPTLKLPPLESGVTTRTAIEWRGIYHNPRKEEAAVQEIFDGWRDRKPRFIIVMPDISSPPGVPHSNSCPPKLYESLLDGSQSYELKAKFHTAPLFSWFDLPALDYPTVNPPIQVFAPRE